MTIQENVPLAPLTTLQVGRTARYFAEMRREDELQEAVQFAKSRDLPLFVLGGGSNLVVADSGWPGLVLRIAIGGITTQTTTTLRAMPCSSAWAPASTGMTLSRRRWCRIARGRVPERHSGKRRRHARAKCWRLWAGGRRNDRIGARAGLERRSRCSFAQASLRIPLSQQHL